VATDDNQLMISDGKWWQVMASDGMCDGGDSDIVFLQRVSNGLRLYLFGDDFCSLQLSEKEM